MKLSVPQTDFAHALSVVSRAVNPNNTLPVLNNILIVAEGKRVTLRATNLEIAMSASFEANVINEGSLTVPSRALIAYVSLLTGDLELTVTGGSTLEISAKDSKSTMKGISAEEFPRLPKLESPKSFTLPAAQLKHAIDEVVFSASSNISRPVLTGVLLRIKESTLILTATDSYRLSEKRVSLESSVENPELSIIIPSKTAFELARVLPDGEKATLEVEVSKGQIAFIADGIQIISRLIEGNFPDYEKILPDSIKTEATLDREAFILALKKVSVIVKDSNNNVRIRVGEQKVEVVSDETQIGQGKAEVVAATTGEVLEAALNVQYLIDVLSHLEDESIHLGLNDGLSPVKVVPEKTSGYLHIIMPLKV